MESASPETSIFRAVYDATGVQQLTDGADFSSEETLQSSLADRATVLNQGFYLDDHNADAGGNLEGHHLDDVERGDAPEITLTTTVDAGVEAGVDLVLLEFGVTAEVELGGSLTFDLNDLPEPEAWVGDVPYWENVQADNSGEWVFDGRLRPYELSTIIDADPMTLVNVGGDLKAALKVGLEFGALGITLFDEEYRIAETTLVKAQVAQPNDYLTIHGNRPVLGQLSDAGDLTLFMGDTAGSRRNAGSNSLADESFEIRSLGPSRNSTDENPLETVMVTFVQGGEEHTQFFDGVRHIHASGGDGEDSIVALSGLQSDVTFIGGAGNDTLTNLGSGHATLQGGSGDDVLQGGVGGGSYYGHYAGASTAAASDQAADGHDQIFGGAGVDLVWAGAGDDLVKTYGGNDVIHGEDGDDVILAGSGDDILYGGAGDDTLQGAAGTDEIYGQGGRDTIQVEIGGVVRPAANDAGESVDPPGELANAPMEADIVDGGADVDTLEILGTAYRDEMTITQVGDPLDRVFEVHTVSTNDGEGENDVSGAVEEFKNWFQLEDSVETITVSGLEGSDSITASGEFNVNHLTLDGGEGDDTLKLENASNNPLDDELAQNTLLGGLGDDRLLGSVENDILEGGAGNDYLFGGGGDDVIFGGAGVDSLDGGTGDDTLDGGGDGDFIDGGDGEDVLYGGSGNDHIFGGAGADAVFGEAGNDWLYGGAGGDSLHGGGGADHIYGQGGGDWLFGGEGDDFLYAYMKDSTSDPNGGEQQDRLFGQGGDDFLLGSDHDDALHGESGNDIIVHTEGNDTVNGGVEESTAPYRYKDEYRVLGTSGADDLLVELHEFAGGGANAFQVRERGEESGVFANLMGIDIVGVETLAGNDRIEVDFGENAGLDIRIDAGEGNDTIDLNSFQNNSELIGGAGFDRVILELLDSATTQNNAISLSDTLLATSETEHSLSGFEAASLRGNAQPNRIDITAFSGEVVMDGLGGNDQFLVGAGASSGIIRGGGGVNSIQYSGGGVGLANNELLKANGAKFGLSQIHTATLAGGGGDDTIDASAFGGSVTIDGGAGRDWIWGGAGNDTLHGGAGNDWIWGGAGKDRLIGGGGNDVMRGGSGDDQLDGEAGESFADRGVDWMYGGGGDDLLVGYYDYLYGDDGDDTLRAVSITGANVWRLLFAHSYEMHGGAGNDWLYGAGYGDRLYGGDGVDRLFGYGGDDYLHGGEGNDYLYGASGDDILHGGSGGDWLYGGSGNDSLYGGTGVDRLYGEDGNDYLDGGRDGVKDYLYGGSGWDWGVQYRYWVYTFAWFGHYVNQEYLDSNIWTINRSW